MVLRKMRAKRVEFLIGLFFMAADMLFFAVMWLAGRGYIEMEPWTVDKMFEGGSTTARIWNLLHAPVNEVFGPLLFPYFRAHGGDLPTILGETAYFILCFLQMFVAGYLVGMLIRRIKRINGSGLTGQSR